MDMKSGKPFAAAVALAFFSVFGGPSIAGTPDSVWTARFGDVTGQVPATLYSEPRIIAGPSGRTFAYGFVEPGRREPGVVGYSGDLGSPLWSTISPFIEEVLSSETQLIPLPDGSSVFLSTTLSRFSADGSLTWSIPKGDLQAVTLLPSGNLIAAYRGTDGSTGGIARVLSATTGATLDSLRIEGGCSDLRLVAAAPDIAYLSSGCSYRRVTRLRTGPLRVEWQLPLDVLGTAVVDTAADASGFYVANSATLIKLSAVDGQLVWNASAVSGWFTGIELDGTGNVVTYGSNIDRWNGTTGANLWHHTDAGVARIDPVLNAVFFAGSASSAVPGGAFAGVAGRLDLPSGNPVWRFESSFNSSVRFTDIAPAGSDIQVIGLVCGAPGNESCETTLWRTDAASGAAFQTSPLVSRTATVGRASLEEGDQTLAAAIEWRTEGPHIRLRTYANATGDVLLESLTSIPSSSAGSWTPDHRLSVIRSSDGNVVASYGTSSANDPSEPLEDAVIMKIDVATGERLWQTFLLDTSAPQSGVHISHPAADSQGNIVIGVLEDYAFDLPNRRWARKFSHESGMLIWQRELPVNPTSASSNITPAVLALGDDVLTERPLGESGSGLTSLSGADGATRWNSAFSFGLVQPLDATSAISFFGNGPQVVIRRLDIDTGALAWTSNYSHPADVSYAIAGGVGGDQNDFYIGGTRRDASATGNGLLLRLDLANGNIVWANRLEKNPVDPQSRVNPRVVHDGKVFATQPFLHTYGYALSAFSLVDGAHTGSEYTSSSPLNHPHLPQHANTGVFGETSIGELMMNGQKSDPGLPSEFTLANRGSALPGGNGALHVTFDLESTSASNAVSYAFAFDAINEGNIAASDVHALLSLPAGTIVESMDCQLAGASCNAITTATSIEGNMTIVPGATLSISGTVRLLPTNNPTNPQWFVASAFAAHPFSELDLKDNVASAPVSDRLFRHGFEQPTW